MTNLNRASYSSTAAVPVDLLGAPWVDEVGGELASHYYRARYYDSKLARFISEDPTGLNDGPNTYAYVHGRVTIRVDPTGLATACWDSLVIEEVIACTAKIVKVEKSGFLPCAFTGKIMSGDFCKTTREEVGKPGPEGKCPKGQKCSNKKAQTLWKSGDRSTVIFEGAGCRVFVELTSTIFKVRGQIGECCDK